MMRRSAPHGNHVKFGEENDDTSGGGGGGGGDYYNYVKRIERMTSTFNGPHFPPMFGQRPAPQRQPQLEVCDTYRWGVRPGLFGRVKHVERVQKVKDGKVVVSETTESKTTTYEGDTAVDAEAGDYIRRKHHAMEEPVKVVY